MACGPTFPKEMKALIARSASNRHAPAEERVRGLFSLLQSGIIYLGASTALVQRLEGHFAWQACRTPQFDRPVAVKRNTWSTAPFFVSFRYNGRLPRGGLPISVGLCAMRASRGQQMPARE
ncbi:MAG: hypothetical protein ABIY47_17255 [Opitutaceae bacterium]